jgi:hypothetical protein
VPDWRFADRARDREAEMLNVRTYPQGRQEQEDQCDQGTRRVDRNAYPIRAEVQRHAGAEEGREPIQDE